MDDTSLDSILNDEPTPETPAIETPTPEQSERARDEHGRFVSASDPGDENPEAATPPTEAAPPAAPQDAEPDRIPVAALRDERQKRQQLEEQLRQYEAYFASQQQPQPQPPAAPDPNEDFAGWLNWRDQQIADQVEQRIMQRVEQYGSQVETSNLVKVTQALARQRHEDYDTVVSGPFMEAVASNPMLVEHLKQAEDPAIFAYNAGKQYEQAKQFGSNAPVSREAIEAEIREKIMAELNLSSTPKAPSSLASERSVGSRSGPAWSGPTAIGDILSR